MCDHLVDPILYSRLFNAGTRSGLVLGIDRRLGYPWVDLDDVTRVRTHGNKIFAIGKGHASHDSYDTGIFAVGTPFFAALASLSGPSITDAVRLLAQAEAATVANCTGLDWIDVDDATALAFAEVGARAGLFVG